MRRITSRIRRAQHGYTLPEVLIGAAVVLATAVLLVSLLQIVFTLYAKNFALNDTHATARGVAERLSRQLESVIEPPELLDEAGARIPGNGPAAGILCVNFSSETPFETLNAINRNSKTIQSRRTSADQRLPQPGDYLYMPQIHDKAYALLDNSAVLARIAGVQSAGASGVIKLDFEKDIGDYFDPPPIGQLVISPGQPFYVLSHSSFIVVPTGETHELRYYPAAMSVEKNGASAFNDPANYRVMAELQPEPNETQSRPFRYTDPSRRFIDLQVRTVARRYDRRLRGTSYTQSSWRTSVGFRSPPLKLIPPP